MAEECRHWRVHLGAHKTATTHLQDTLEAVMPQLAGFGITYVPRETFRGAGGLPEFGAIHRMLCSAGLSRPGLPAGHWLRELGRQAEILLLSEENLLGSASDLLHRNLYPQAVSRLQTLRQAAGNASMSVFLAVRSLDTLLPSAYAQRSRFGRSRPGEFESVRKLALQQPVRWLHFVERLVKIFPPADITIWRFEDYTAAPERFLSELCGVSALHFPVLETPSSTRSPSAEAILATEQLDPGMSRKARERAAITICENDTGNRRFKPFSPAEASLLAEAYAKDLATIRSRYPGIRFL